MTIYCYLSDTGTLNKWVLYCWKWFLANINSIKPWLITKILLGSWYWIEHGSISWSWVAFGHDVLVWLRLCTPSKRSRIYRLVHYSSNIALLGLPVLSEISPSDFGTAGFSLITVFFSCFCSLFSARTFLSCTVSSGLMRAAKKAPCRIIPAVKKNWAI